jgi:replicative DNA helicase
MSYLGKVVCADCGKESAIVYNDDEILSVRCQRPDCESAYIHYKKTDKRFKFTHDTEAELNSLPYDEANLKSRPETKKQTSSLFPLEVFYYDKPHRGISPETLAVFEYGYNPEYYTPYGKKAVEVASYYDKDECTYKQKIKYGSGKSKFFSALVDYDNNDVEYFFGQNTNQKRFKNRDVLVITEGEPDAMSVHEAFKRRSNWTPYCVSLPYGCRGLEAIIKHQLSWILQFDEILICMDSDEKGKRGANSLSKMLNSEKVKIVHLTDYKDANEYAKAGKYTELCIAVEQAKANISSIVMPWSEVQESILRSAKGTLDTGIKTIDKMLGGGIPKAGTTIICGGTGVGKSTLAYAIAGHRMTTDNVVVINTEMANSKALAAIVTGTGDSNLMANLDDEESVASIVVPAIEQYYRTDKLLLLRNDFNAKGWSDFYTQLKSVVSVYSTDLIVLDNLSGVLGGKDDTKRHEFLQRVVKDLNDLSLEFGVSNLVLSHLTSNGGGKLKYDDTLTTTYEHGAEVTLANIRSSGDIANFASLIMSYERDIREADGRVKLRILKDRDNGNTNSVAMVYFDRSTWRFGSVKYGDILGNPI